MLDIVFIAFRFYKSLACNKKKRNLYLCSPRITHIKNEQTLHSTVTAIAFFATQSKVSKSLASFMTNTFLVTSAVIFIYCILNSPILFINLILFRFYVITKRLYIRKYDMLLHVHEIYLVITRLKLLADIVADIFLTIVSRDDISSLVSS